MQLGFHVVRRGNGAGLLQGLPSLVLEVSAPVVQTPIELGCARQDACAATVDRTGKAGEIVPIPVVAHPLHV